MSERAFFQLSLLLIAPPREGPRQNFRCNIRAYDEVHTFAGRQITVRRVPHILKSTRSGSAVRGHIPSKKNVIPGL
jgi:hypothetical protein